MNRSRLAGIALACSTVMASPAHAITSIGLSNYAVVGNHALPTLSGLGLEASAVTFARDRNSLFVVGDEGLGVVEYSLTGQFLGSMAFNWVGTGSTHNDAEGLTYRGSGQLVMVDERPQIAYSFSFLSGGTVALASTPWAAITGSTTAVGNVGTEGISHDPRDGSFVSVNQDNPLELRVGGLNFAVGGGTSSMTVVASGATSLFGVASFSDVQTLSPIDALAGTPAADNLLILSLDSRWLIEVTPSGSVLGSLDLSTLTTQALEGLTVDHLGNIYLVAEESGQPNSRLFVLSPVPEASTWALWLAGLAGLTAVASARRRGP